jgi:hypothetical protein
VSHLTIQHQQVAVSHLTSNSLALPLIFFFAFPLFKGLSQHKRGQGVTEGKIVGPEMFVIKMVHSNVLYCINKSAAQLAKEVTVTV